MEYEDLRKQVVDAGLKMFRKEMTHGTSGNISCRVPGKEKMLITPSSIAYEEIKTKDIILVNFAEDALPGSEELAKNVLTVLGDKNALLLANHGAVCCGKNLSEAFHVAETVEKICRFFVLSSILGEVKSLPSDGVEYQRMMY